MRKQVQTNVTSKNPKTVLMPFFAFTLFLTVLSGCKKEVSLDVDKPYSCFVSMEDSVYINKTITFDPTCSVGGTSFLWNFGDGTTATTASATHVYTTPGTYTISLTVSNSGGTSISSKTIVVLPCEPGYEGVNCATEIRSKFFGIYDVSGTINCSLSGTSNLFNQVTVSMNSSSITKLSFNIDGVILVGDLNSNLTSVSIPSQQSGGFTYSGTGTFTTTTLTLSLTETENVSGEICNISTTGPKR